jgi:hypothetical protein
MFTPVVQICILERIGEARPSSSTRVFSLHTQEVDSLILSQRFEDCSTLVRLRVSFCGDIIKQVSSYSVDGSKSVTSNKKEQPKKTLCPLVRKRTIPTERPPLVGEI